MTWVNGRIAASVGTADSYVSFPILYLFIFRKTLVAKIRIIFSDQAHSSLKKRGFAKIQNNDEPSTPTGVELQVTARKLFSADRLRANTASAITSRGVLSCNELITLQRPVPFCPAASSMLSIR